MVATQSQSESTPIPEWRAAADEIWAMMKETREQMQETDRRMQETDRRMQETDRRMQETDRQMKETDRQMKETDRRLGKLTNRFGEMVEYMIVPNLVEKFRELDFEFNRTSRDMVIVDRKHDISLEVDAFLENGDKVMVVEIKNKPDDRDINEHVERMEKLRKYADLRGDKRHYLGALGGVIFSDSARIYALKHGLYVIEPSGDTFRITEPTGQYHPHIW